MVRIEMSTYQIHREPVRVLEIWRRSEPHDSDELVVAVPLDTDEHVTFRLIPEADNA